MSRLKSHFSVGGRGREARGLTLTAPISLYKHSTDFCLLLCFISFCSCLVIGPIKKISLASWAIDLLSAKHFCCRKLHLKSLGTHLIRFSLFGRRMLYNNSHFIEEICNYFFHFEICAIHYPPPPPPHHFTIFSKSPYHFN